MGTTVDDQNWLTAPLDPTDTISSQKRDISHLAAVTATRIGGVEEFQELCDMLPSAEARQRMWAQATVLWAVLDAAGRESIEYGVALWFSERASREYRQALWADEARYLGVFA